MARRQAVIALLLMLALLPLGTAKEPLGSDWRIALEITTQSSGTAKMFEAFDAASLNTYDFDGDGRTEIISVNDNNHLYVLDGASGRVLADLETYHYDQPHWPVRELNPVSVGDLYGNDIPCMVVPNSASYLTAFCFDLGSSTPEKFVFAKMWQTPVDAARYEPDFKEKHPFLYHENGTAKHQAGMDGHAYLADVDGDGKLEVFVETDSWPGTFAFSHDGKYLWSRSFADGNAGAIVRDIDKDGVKEAVFFADGGLVVSHDARTGGIEWVFDTRKHGATPGSIPVPGLVADLEGDGKYEIVFGARQAVETEDPDWIDRSHARYYALDHRGNLIWNVSYDWMNPLQYNHPAAADVNGDGVLDVVFIDWNTIGHYPGNWDTTNRKSNLFALDGRDGSALWHRGITIYWSNKDFVIMDVDGDGGQEIVAPTAKGSSEGLGIYSLRSGDELGWFGIPGGWGMSRGPVAADLNGDGKLSLVIPMSRPAEGQNYRSLDVGYREGKLVIVDTNALAKTAVFTANFLNNDQVDLGLKGTSGTPRPTPTPASTTPPSTATPTTSTPLPTGPSPGVRPEAQITPTVPAITLLGLLGAVAWAARSVRRRI